MQTRRKVLVGGVLTLFFVDAKIRPCAGFSRPAPHTRGCCLADEDLNAVYPPRTPTQAFSTGVEPIPSSANADFDLALAHTLAKLSDDFQVLPGFAYYDDSGSKNALATPHTRMDRADGTVLMGKTLLLDLIDRLESPEVAIAGVCAHEFGHIVQFRHNLIPIVNRDQPNVRNSELQADYFAGYFAGLRKRERPTFPAAVIAMTVSGFGDTAFNDRNHHGTAQERGAAVVQGFEASFRQNKSLSEAIQDSTTYVLGL